MTDLATSITIAAPAAVIYEFAAATERWPLILPHYRYVRVRERRGATRIVEMAAWRHVFPLHWTAEQTNDPAGPRIAFRHIAGPTRGMLVEWTFTPAGDSTRVTIAHRLDYHFPIGGDFVARRIVGGYFIDGVARRTLACVRRVAEASPRA